MKTHFHTILHHISQHVSMLAFIGSIIFETTIQDTGCPNLTSHKTSSYKAEQLIPNLGTENRL
jgi:hypothetical protein